MHKRCSNCRLVNYADAVTCSRCDADLVEAATEARGRRSIVSTVIIRAVICVCACVAALLAFYFSLVFSAKPLSVDQKYQVRQAIRLLRAKGFTTEAMLLDNFTIYRADDNWLNASVAKENAYAATNFPFEIMTLYSDFFTYPADDVERAAILLHESKHLQGADEPEAYEFVWKNRAALGWTKDKYARSVVWQNVRHQTLEASPHIFNCPEDEVRDCTELQLRDQ